MTNPQPTQLVCPRCQSADNLATIEQLTAAALISGIRRSADGSHHVDYVGESDVAWDTQTWDGRILTCRACCIDLGVEELLALAVVLHDECELCGAVLLGELRADRACPDCRRDYGAIR